VTSLPLLPVTTVGSWPRPLALLKSLRDLRAGRIAEATFERAADAAVLEVIRAQEAIGVDIITDGEQRRDNFVSFVARKLTGVRMMTLADLLEVIEDRAGFERILQTLDLPAYSITNPTCVGPVERDRPLAVDELRFLKAHTEKPVKIALPGPYLLTRSMFVKEVSRPHYATKEALGEAVVGVLRQEVAELVDEGADFIQFDEPVLTELVFTQGQTRTFMCAALAARNDPAEELEFAVSLLNRVVEGVRGTRTGLHVCRGNWSRDESTLLRGGYAPLQPYLERMHVDQLVLEYATERAGDLLRFEGKELGLGVVNPRTEAVESPAAIRESVERALGSYPRESVFLNPDCGFSTFSNRPMNSMQVATHKLEAIVEVARSYRDRAVC